MEVNMRFCTAGEAEEAYETIEEARFIPSNFLRSSGPLPDAVLCKMGKPACRYMRTSYFIHSSDAKESARFIL